MGLTQQAVSGLGAKVVGHDEIKGARVLLPTGLIKTEAGLIARPSHSGKDARSGALVEVHQGEFAALQENSEADAEDAADLEVSERPVKRRSVRRRSSDKVTEPSIKHVDVKMSMQGFGEISTTYAHMYVGVGVIILGLTKGSCTPPVYNNQVGKLIINDTYNCVYLGNSFVDNNGITNLILAIM